MSEVLYKFYTLEDMTQEDLNNLALERNNLHQENTNLKQALNEIKDFINDYEPLDRSQVLSIIQIIDKVLGDDEK